MILLTKRVGSHFLPAIRRPGTWLVSTHAMIQLSKTIARWDNGQIVEENLVNDLVTFMRCLG
jgi:hypothetical protein